MSGLELLHNPMFIIFSSLTLVAVVGCVCLFQHKMKKDALEADLKREMIARGMSADEIQQVIEATSGNGTCGDRDSK